MKHQEIIYSVTGQTLFFDAPEGRPSSVTSVTVYELDEDDDGATEAATTGSAAVETNPNTTFDAASGVSQSDQTQCNLTATTGIARGRRYLVTNATGETEWVEVKEIGSGAYVKSRVPLRNDYTTADTFQSTRISISVDSTWVADENNISDWCDGHDGYRVRWVYVVGGVTYVHASFFSLVRYPRQNLVSPLDVDAVCPGWIDRNATDYQEDQGAALVERAYEAVRFDALADEKLLRRVRDTQVLANLVCYKANLLAAEDAINRGGTNTAALELAREKYNQRYQQLIREPKVRIDPGENGAGYTARRSPLWRR